MELLLKNLIQNILIVAFLVGLLRVTYTFQQKKSIALEYGLSIEETQCWKGLLSLFIVLDHLWMRYNIVSLAIFHESAVIIVSIFFFFSGYGVCVSTVKNPDYMGLDFWEKRIKYLVLPMVIVDFIMFLWRYLCGLRIDFALIFHYLTGKELFNGQTWYIRELLLCYFFFYLLVKMRLSPRAIIAGCIICITLMNIVLFLCGYGYNWYGSNYGFCLGIGAGYLDGRRCETERKREPFVMITSFVLTAVFSILYKCVGKEITWNILFTRNAMTFTATILFICVAGRLIIKPGICDKVSSVSMEIYLIHMIVIKLCMEIGLERQPIVLVSIVLIAVIFLGNLYHRFLNHIWKM